MKTPAPSRFTLPPRLDGTAIDRLPSPHAARHGTDPLILDASGVRDIDPVGVALLWLWCRVLLPSRTGGIRLIGLAPPLDGLRLESADPPRLGDVAHFIKLK